MRLLPVVAVALLTVAGCGASNPDTAKRDTIVAAFYPLAWAAERIGGEHVDVVNLTPPGAEPHDLELSPRDVERIHDAELVVYAGGGFQPALEDALQDYDGPALDILPPGETDPHVWLDPLKFVRVAEKIGARLGSDAAALELVAKLRAVDVAYQRELRSCQRRTFVTSHAAFGHLAARYGLKQVSLEGVTPEAEPSARDLERLVGEVRASGATTVFTEPLVSDRLARTVARETGARVVTLDPIEGLSDVRLAAGEDYVSVMDDNLTALREALGCR